MPLSEALGHAKVLLEALSRGEYCCLRHGLPYVTPSLLSEQVFCEAKLDMRLSRGDPVEAKPRRELRMLLEALLGARRLLRDTGGRYTLSTPLAAVVEGLPLVGRPAVLGVEGDCVSVVYMLRGRRGKLYPTEVVKGYAYGAMLEELGASCGSLRIAYVAAENPSQLRKAIESLEDPLEPASLAGEGFEVRVRIYNPPEARSTIAHLAAYWTGRRPPRPRPGPWCTRCPYRGFCPATSLE
ncbi:MAG: hypothetical protein GXO15_01880 [Crenarchaeota archaeon]|nr:hypothetical protein [Thermoproteota archaeon]